MLQSSLHTALCVVGPALAAAGCGSPAAVQQPAIEWNTVPTGQGTLNVALVRPDNEGPGPHPVILALPWGSGSAQLVESFIQSYWLNEPGARGYYVVAPEVRGSTLDTRADEVIPAIFDWMVAELSFDPDRVALVGASNGGRGAFFAALSQPHRFKAVVGLPGQYAGDAADLIALVETPVWLLVGEFDDSWVDAARSTAAALDSQGVSVRLDIVPGEGHVIALDPRSLLDWIDTELAR